MILKSRVDDYLIENKFEEIKLTNEREIKYALNHKDEYESSYQIRIKMKEEKKKYTKVMGEVA